MAKSELLHFTNFNNLMFDTNVVDCLLDNPKTFEIFIQLKATMKFRVYLTYIQHGEIVKTATAGKLKRFLNLSRAVHLVETEILASEATILDYAVLDSDKLPSDETLLAFEEFLGAAKEGNHIRDAVIAVTASTNSALLISNDGGMKKKAERLNIKTMAWLEFQDQLLKLAV